MSIKDADGNTVPGVRPGSQPQRITNSVAKPKEQTVFVAPTATDAEYAAERTADGQSLVDSIPPPDRFVDVHGNAHSSVDVTGYVRFSANLWDVTVAGVGVVRVNQPNFGDWMDTQ